MIIWVCTHMWPSTNICVHWCVKRSQKNIQYCVFLKFFQSYYLGKGLSANLGLLFHVDLHSFPHCWDCRHLIKMLGSKLRSLPFSQHPSPTKSVFFSLFSLYNIIKVVCPGIIPCHTHSGQWEISVTATICSYIPKQLMGPVTCYPLSYLGVNGSQDSRGFCSQK